MSEFLKGVVSAIGGGVGTFVLLQIIKLPRFDLDFASGLLLLLALIPLLYLAVAFHEGGHLLAGAIRGFRPCLFIVGPLKLERQGGRWRVGRNRVLPGFGGLAAGIPEHTERLRQRMLMLIAGGPAASLLTGLAALAALYSLRTPGPRVTLVGTDATAYILLLVFCLVSLGIGCIALVPGRAHGYSTDGSQILRFMKETPEVEAEVALVALSTTSMAGKRPRDWDPSLVAQTLKVPADSPRGPLARLLAHTHALDRGDIEPARHHLVDALAHREHVMKMARPAILLAAAEFAALHDHDAASARRWFDEAGEGAMIGVHTRLFAEAAVLHAEGKPHVEERLTLAATALKESIDRGGALMLEDQIAALRERRIADRAGGTTPAASP